MSLGEESSPEISNRFYVEGHDMRDSVNSTGGPKWPENIDVPNEGTISKETFVERGPSARTGYFPNLPTRDLDENKQMNLFEKFHMQKPKRAPDFGGKSESEKEIDLNNDLKMATFVKIPMPKKPKAFDDLLARVMAQEESKQPLSLIKMAKIVVKILFPEHRQQAMDKLTQVADKFSADDEKGDNRDLHQRILGICRLSREIRVEYNGNFFNENGLVRKSDCNIL